MQILFSFYIKNMEIYNFKKSPLSSLAAGLPILVALLHSDTFNRLMLQFTLQIIERFTEITNSNRFAETRIFTGDLR